MRSSWFAAGILLVALAGGVHAEVTLPETPAGAALSEWLDLVRAGDADKAREHFEASFSESFRQQVSTDMYMGLFGQVGALLGQAEIAAVTEDSEHELLARAKTAAGWFNISLTVNPGKPDEITGLLIQPGEAPEQAETTYDDWVNLSGLLQQVRADRELPAIAAAWVRDGKIVDRAVVGQRRADREGDVAVGDRFHFGSLTKSITATVIARLIDRGKLSWDTTLAEALPGIEMHEGYGSVTVEQALRHRAGFPPKLTFDGPEMERLVGLSGKPTQQRAKFAAEVLAEAPAVEPGTQTSYTNAGYAVLGLIAERAAKTEWSKLVRKEVFSPLRLESCGFGWPATKKREDQPHGHYREGDGWRVQEVGEYPLGEFLAPAGDTHGNIEDLARYAAFHLAALRGEGNHLKTETARRLHRPAEGADYAGGWMIREADDGLLHWHNGSAGTFYALVGIYPESNEAIVVAVNAADGAESAAIAIGKAIRERSKE